MERFGDVPGSHSARALQVGQGPGHPEDPIVGPAGQVSPLHGRGEEGFSSRIRLSTKA